MLSRREFRARGPLPPWWRRPGVLAVVGLLVVGAGLALAEGIGTMLAGRQVRDLTLQVRGMELPRGLEDWSSACGFYGVRCARSAESPELAVRAMAAAVRELGHEVSPVACGAAARVEPGTTLAATSRHDRQCVVTTEVSGGVLTVAAWDYLPPSGPGRGAGIELGATALVVEWDVPGRDRLVATEPGRMEARFADVRLSAAELAALPGALADAECTGRDEDGCLGHEAVLDGPGEGRELVETWARRLEGAGFLLSVISCETASSCHLAAELGRPDGELTRIGVSISVLAERPGTARATIHAA